MKPSTEFTTKQAQVRALLDEKSLDALIVQHSANFAWLTCGAAGYVHLASHRAAAALVVTHENSYLVCNTIEAPRLRDEEKLEEAGWQMLVGDWHRPDTTIETLTANMAVGGDGFYPGLDLSAELGALRINLSPEEQARFRSLGAGCAQAMQAAVEQLRQGLSEFEIAAILGAEAQRRGVLPVVNLIATDERVSLYRHPLPTAKTLDKYAMLVLCGRQSGLVCSITRLVHFGRPPDELRRRAGLVAQVDAALIGATRPGAELSDIFHKGQQAYQHAGFPNEWRLHHQGGPAGYLPREMLATPESKLTVKAGQAYAWNPSIAGVKSEDTILVGEEGNTVLTEISGWPAIQVGVDRQAILRPTILEIS